MLQGTVRRAFVFAFGMIAGGAGARAQCTTQWQPGGGVPGLAGDSGASVAACAYWDPDGSGPMSSRLAIAGRFSGVADAAARNIASLDPVTGRWAPFGTGIGLPSAGVKSIAPLPNGDLGVLLEGSSSVWQWSGSWSSLGALPREPGVLRALPASGLVATCPEFVQTFPPVGMWVDQLYQWHGSTWSLFGPQFLGLVACMVTMPNGDLVVAGSFTAIGTTATNCIARWDGSAWLPLGNGFLDGQVVGLAVAPNGDLIAVGSFTIAGGSPGDHVARWDGTAWSALGSGFTDGLSSATATPNGDVWVGGYAYANPAAPPQGFIARWDGNTWSPANTSLAGPMSTSPSTVRHVQGLANGELLVTGDFVLAGGAAALGIAIWDGAAWRAIGSGLDTPVQAMTSLPDGDIVTGGAGVNSLMRWDGAAWTSMGRIPGQTSSLATLSNGDAVAAGVLEASPGNLAAVMRWSGSTWAPVGALAGPSRAIATLLNDDIVVGFEGGATGDRLFRWDGSSWTAIGSPVDGSVFVLHRLANGDLIAAGSFTTAGGVAARSIVRWDGVTWSALGAGFDGQVLAVAELPNGQLAVGGEALTGAHVQVWDGANWTAAGSLMASVDALLALPDGDLLAGGSFRGSGQPSYLARWDGLAWSQPSGGMDARVRALGAAANGDVIAGGVFQTAGGVMSPFAARLAPTCPATASTIATSCTASAGPLVLRGGSLPWIGSTCHTYGSGVGANALIAAVEGFSSPAIPLSAIHPGGLPNCFLLASADTVRLLLPAGGVVASAIAIPRHPALAGMPVYQQLLQLEGLGGPIALSSSNALLLTVGMF